MQRKASCCCGQLSIAVEGEPRLHAICHCDDCKRRTGSAFGVSVYFNDSQIIDTTGKTLVYEINNEHSQQRYFCPECGTTLYWKLSQLAEKTGIAGGCFTGHSLPDPEYSLTSGNKCSWLFRQSNGNNNSSPRISTNTRNSGIHQIITCEACETGLY